MGMSQEMVEYTIDGWHSLYDGAGIYRPGTPRMAAICHYVAGGGPIEAEARPRSEHIGTDCSCSLDPTFKSSTSRRTRSRHREAALPDGAAVASIDPRWLVPPGAELPDEMQMPTPRIPRADQQDASLREMEIDPHLYYPPDVERDQVSTWPEDGITIRPKRDAESTRNRHRQQGRQLGLSTATAQGRPYRHLWMPQPAVQCCRLLNSTL